MEIRKYVILLTLVYGLFASNLFSQQIELSSPDRNTGLKINIGGGITYSVYYNGNKVISESPFSLEFSSSAAYEKEFVIENKKTQSVNKQWEPLFGRHKTIRNHYNELQLLVREEKEPARALKLIFRAYDDGIAFRYNLPKPAPMEELELIHENTHFNFDKNYTAWMADYNSFVSHQEKEFRRKLLSDIKNDSIVGLPLLVKIDDVGYAAITEANLTNWAGMYLTAAKNNVANRFSIKTTLSPIPGSEPIPEHGFEPKKVKIQIRQSSPWRVIMLGKEPGELIESEILMNLNEPCRLKDTDWIRPGKCVWDHWWSGGEKVDNQTIKEYIDFASEMGFPYQLIDWQWYGEFNTPDSDITTVNPNINLPQILEYAKRKKVKCWLWLYWTDAERQYKEAFALYEKWGIAGVKIDFMQRDDQEMVNWYHKIIKAAGKHHLMVNFHGAYKPTGFRRTYPNLMTREGVLGNEYNKWSTRVTPEHNVTLVFTRNLLGEMDYTPGGFLNRAKNDFKAASPTQVMGTRCHQLAMFVVYDSPITTVCDHPENYHNQPGLEFLRIVPVVWDDIEVINGEVGEYITIAKRMGDDFFLGAMTNNFAREFRISLDFLNEGKYKALIFKDAPDSDKNAEHLVKEEVTVEKDEKLDIKMASGGGYAAYFKKAD